jgi:hypothetical protein
MYETLKHVPKSSSYLFCSKQEQKASGSPSLQSKELVTESANKKKLDSAQRKKTEN